MKMVAPPQKQNPPPRGPDFEVPPVSLFGGDMGSTTLIPPRIDG